MKAEYEIDFILEHEENLLKNLRQIKVTDKHSKERLENEIQHHKDIIITLRWVLE